MTKKLNFNIHKEFFLADKFNLNLKSLFKSLM
jgi:hypothetical protein